MKLYIAVLDEFPDYMTPTLVAHAVLGAHLHFVNEEKYQEWLTHSFKKCVVRVNRKEFDKISKLPRVYLAHENNTLNGEKACAVVCPYYNQDIPNVLSFAKLWSPVSTVMPHKKHVWVNDDKAFGAPDLTYCKVCNTVQTRYNIDELCKQN